jgi:hypothetical protein
MLKRLKIINLMVIASLMLVLTVSSFDKARAQALNIEACDGVPFSIGWISIPVTPSVLAPPDFVAGLLGTIEGFGGNAVGGLDWLYNDASFLNTNLVGSQLISWWSQKNGRNTLLQVTNTNDGPIGVGDVAVHVQILREDCVEIRDFCDFYTFNDTHVYDFSDIISNFGQDISDLNIQGREGTVVITPVSECVLGSSFPAIGHNFFQGNLTLTDPNNVDYGTNVYARFAETNTTQFECLTLSGDPGCEFETIVPSSSTLLKDFNVVGANVAAADLVFLQFADLFGPAYKAVPAFSQFGPFVVTNAAEEPESCTPIIACFARLGIDDALPISEDFPGVGSPSPTPPTPCDSDADCTVTGEVCNGEVAGTCSTTTTTTCFLDSECPTGETCTGEVFGTCGAPPTPIPTTTPTPTPDGDGGGGGGGCAIAGPVSLGTAMANVILPLIPVAFAFGLGALRRRNRKEDK